MKSYWRYVWLIACCAGCIRDQEGFEREELYKVYNIPFENEVLSVSRTGALLPAPPYLVYFLDSLTGLLASTSSEIYRTTNGGLSWQVVAPIGAFGTTYRDMCFPHPDTGYVLLQWFDQTPQGSIPWGAVLRTVDSGLTWDTAWKASQVVYAKMACNEGGAPVIFRDINNEIVTVTTRDGGATWSDTDYPQTYIWELFAGGNYVIANGFGVGRLSADRGQTWTDLDIWGDQILRSVSITDTTAYGVLENQNIVVVNLHTRVINSVFAPTRYNEVKTHAISDTECLLIGNGNVGGVENDFLSYGIFGYTHDSGQSWEEWMFSDFVNWTHWHAYTPRAGYIVIGQQLIHVQVK